MVHLLATHRVALYSFLEGQHQYEIQPSHSLDQAVTPAQLLKKTEDSRQAEKFESITFAESHSNFYLNKLSYSIVYEFCTLTKLLQTSKLLWQASPQES